MRIISYIFSCILLIVSSVLFYLSLSNFTRMNTIEAKYIDLRLTIASNKQDDLEFNKRLLKLYNTCELLIQETEKGSNDYINLLRDFIEFKSMCLIVARKVASIDSEISQMKQDNAVFMNSIYESKR